MTLPYSSILIMAHTFITNVTSTGARVSVIRPNLSRITFCIVAYLVETIQGVNIIMTYLFNFSSRPYMLQLDSHRLVW